MRAVLLHLGEEEHALLLSMHHIVTDGWSLELLVHELNLLYAAGAAGEPSRLAEPPLQYADFALWQRRWLSGEVLAEQLSYWRQQLGGAPAQELPTDRPVPKARSPRGASLAVEFAPDLARGLLALANRHGATLFMAVLAGYAALLARYSWQEDVVVGSPVANRNRRETEEVVGFFVNTLALRIDLAGHPTGRRLLVRVREAALDAFAHQDLPFEKLAGELPPVRAVLALETDAAAALELPGLATAPWPLASRTAKFDLTLDLSAALDGPRRSPAWLGISRRSSPGWRHSPRVP